MKYDTETDSLRFQCKDIVSRDAVPDTTIESDSSGGSYDGSASGSAPKEYQILLFGTDALGQSVALQITDFKPYFYIRIPDALAENMTAHTNFEMCIADLCEHRHSELSRKNPHLPPLNLSKVKYHIETHEVLLDYTGGYKATFMKIVVPTLFLWRFMKDCFLDKSSEPITYKTATLFGAGAIKSLANNSNSDVLYVARDGSEVALKVYEANIDPVLRFFHERDLSPAGWVQVPENRWDYANSMDASVKVFATASWSDVQPADESSLAPFLVGSWDIECNSSHGDFPVAVKTWKKPIRELHESGMPTTIEEFCNKLADAINHKPGPLSPIYTNPRHFKIPRTSQALQECIRIQKQEANIRNYLVDIKNAETGEAREKAMTALDDRLSQQRGNKDEKIPPVFPYHAIQGDEVIQIGIVLYRKAKPISKHIWVLKSVDAAAVRPPGEDVPIEVYSFEDEATMLRAWFQWLGRTDPDILIGYNIFGFDSKYVWDRLGNLVGFKETIKITSPLSALKSRPTKLEEKFLSSSAMGDNTMHFMNSPGRLQIDLLPYIRRNHNLDSYSLDNVSATFVSGAIQSLKPTDDPESFIVATKSTKGTLPGRFITLMDDENDRIVEKAEVLAVAPKALTIKIKGGQEKLKDAGTSPVKWAQVKDDVSPKDIFKFHRGTAKERGIVARYCLQDCDLVMELFHKLDILNNSIAMANVCSVPVSFIFLRGQGVKIESLIFKECRKADQLIEVMPSPPRNNSDDPIIDDGEPKDEDDSYEGAIVLDPKTGIYINDPITADDFASLYPSSIISENISHDTLIWVKDFDTTPDGQVGKFRCLKEGSDRYDNIPGASYVNIEFDILRPDPTDERKHPTKIRDGKRIARYIQNPQGSIPRILEMLLSSRKKCRKAAEKEPDEFKKALLDAQQLAYKLTANSLYGQLGSGTFKIRRQVLAASTTAYGRKQLMFAKEVIETLYGGGKDPRCDAECVYGDTDSIFLRFRPKNPETGEPLTGDEALKVAKELTIESGKLVSSCLKPPHDFEFDKIFRTFCLLSKKRYVGDMSEDGLAPEDFHRKSMGIVMKRRDNAPIVKYVYGGAIERILDPTRPVGSSGVKDAFDFVQATAKDLLAGKVPMTKLMITKSLRAGYANPTRIAHKVLADRIAERDPGNKPSTSERMSFVYIQSTATLQGDRIETPSFIKEHGLKPDYVHYITNQIAKPVAQVFALELEKLPGVKRADIDACKKARDPVAAREKLAESLLFGKLLTEDSHRPEVMEAKGQRSIAAMFANTKKSV